MGGTSNNYTQGIMNYGWIVCEKDYLQGVLLAPVITQFRSWVREQKKQSGGRLPLLPTLDLSPFLD